jgi:uncharacterized membrane protein YdbT with pleckstrin-like domain
MDKAQTGMQTPVNPFENRKKHHLGHRAFTLFLFSRIKFLFFLIVLTVGIGYAVQYLPPNYLLWAPFIVKLAIAITVAYFVFIFLRTYLEYRYYTYLFTEEAFIMTSGYMLRSEVAALYHQIQNVNILRGPLDRLIGVSRIMILMTGDKSNAQNQLILPGVGKTKAKLVQQELLTRARKHFNGAI